MNNEAMLSQIHHLLGIGRAEEAATLAADGLQQDPTSVALLELMARAQLQLENYPAAIDAAQSALALDAGALGALLSLADGYSLIDNHRDALAVADAAVETAPHSAGPYFIRAAVRYRSVTPFVLRAGGRTGRDELQRGIDDIDRALEISPTASSFHALRGQILQRAGYPGPARTAYTRAVELDPHNAHALTLLGESNIDQLRLGDAHDDVSAGLGVSPQSAHLQKRSRQFLRMRAFVPMWVASLTPSLAFLVTLVAGHRGPITTAVVIIGTLASIGFAIWWWRRLSPSNRNRFLHGDARRVLIFATIFWVLLTLAGIVFLFSGPTVESWTSSGADTAASDTPQLGGVDLLAMLTMAITGVGPAVAGVIWLQSRSMRATANINERLYDRKSKRRRAG